MHTNKVKTKKAFNGEERGVISFIDEDKTYKIIYSVSRYSFKKIMKLLSKKRYRF